MPTVREIVRKAEANGNRFESIVYEIVASEAFRMREGLSATETETPAQQVTLQTGGL